MKLLFVHGAPACGKRTVGQAVVHLTNGRLFDNHAAVDFARTVIDFDAPGFWDLVHSARIIALEKAAEHGVPLVIQTMCYSHPDDLPLLEDFERVLGRHGGILLPVFLSCSTKTLEARVGALDLALQSGLLGGICARWSEPHNRARADLDPMTYA